VFVWSIFCVICHVRWRTLHSINPESEPGAGVRFGTSFEIRNAQSICQEDTQNISQKSVQGKAKQLIHGMYLAPIRKAALRAYDQFISSYQVKFPKACECLHNRLSGTKAICLS
jgi:hypothetical protein